MDYKALALEVRLDPTGLGYAGKPNAQIADLLHALRDVARTALSGDELLECTALAELVALDAAKTAAYWGLAGKDSINVTAGTNTRAILAAIFGAGTATRAAIIALLAVPLKISRANQLSLGEVWPGHVGKALAQWG